MILWAIMTEIGLMPWVSIVSGNGLAPVRHQAITETNDDLLAGGHLGTKLCGNWIKTWKIYLKNLHWKFCLWDDVVIGMTWEIHHNNINSSCAQKHLISGYIICHTLGHTYHGLTHWSRDKMAAISQTTFSNAFSWLKMFEYWWNFHWCFPKGPINNIPALVQIMAWRLDGAKPIFEPMMFFLLTHIRVTRPQWVNGIHYQEIHPPVRDSKCCVIQSAVPS